MFHLARILSLPCRGHTIRQVLRLVDEKNGNKDAKQSSESYQSPDAELDEDLGDVRILRNTFRLVIEQCHERIDQ